MKRTKKIITGIPANNPRAIVRPFQSATPTPSRPPQFTYRGGPLIAQPILYPVFWGKSWTTLHQDLMNQINTFYDTAATGSLFDQLQEYSIPNFSISRGSHPASYIITSPLITKYTFDFLIRNMLRRNITNGTITPPSKNSLYIVYTEPNVAVIKGVSFSCVNFCGYHDVIDNSIFYAVINYPICKPCIANLPGTLEAMTVSTSHELCEVITDPIPGTGWYDNLYGEIGDVCEWQTKQINNFTVQKEWSNNRGSCI